MPKRSRTDRNSICNLRIHQLQPTSSPSATEGVNLPSPAGVGVLEYVVEMPSEEIWEEDDMIALAAEGLAVQPASGPSATAEVNPPSPVDVNALEYVGEMPSEVIWEEDVMELTAEGLADDEEKGWGYGSKD